MIERTSEDIKNAIKATGAIYEEELEDGSSIFTSKPLSEVEKANYHKEAIDNLQIIADDYTKYIDKQIVNNIIKNFK